MKMRGQWIGGAWRGSGAQTAEGPAFASHDPGTGEIVWDGAAASKREVEAAITAAAGCAADWARGPLEQRLAHVDAFGVALARQAADLQDAISRETGKPRWESKTECDALIGKIGLTKAALAARQSPSSSVKDGLTSATRYKPLGPVAVLGPFNLPAHLPNGQIIPALLAGNTAVFKPSEMTPLVGEIYARCWEEAGLPPGVFNMVQGAREVGAALVGDPRVQGVFFTGSRAGGVALSKTLAAQPEKMLALEMGGFNPLLATHVADMDAAAYAIVQSAFITAGQRCTCARQLILLRDAEGDRLLQRLIEVTRAIRVGHYTQAPEPFIGPVISAAAAQRLLAAHAALVADGGVPLAPLESRGHAFLTPAIIDCTRRFTAASQNEKTHEELFGPILQVARAENIEHALRLCANPYGLAAGLLSQDRALWERFYAGVHAGIINWNRPTTGASGALPFGGLGGSGNHRPAGAFAIDFCADPVASLESESLTLPAHLAPGISL